MQKKTYSIFESDLQVRPDDIDMNGHVHNSKYLDYVLAARFDQMQRCYGMSMEDFLQRGLSWYVRAAYIQHKRPLFLGDTVSIRTGVAEVRSRGVKVEFEIIRQSDQKLSAKGYFDYVMVDKETGKARIIDADIVEKYSV
ncbi:MAG: acyl-CoA thioesterase [Verrucomicrobiales bacterium]|nr:acyl-CoA thioesterase [Verrucomicrobiales bacterium]